MLFEDIGIKYEILGSDMQLEGITKNQSFGLDEHDKPAEEILQKIMRLANPDGKLVYVIKPKAPGVRRCCLLRPGRPWRSAVTNFRRDWNAGPAKPTPRRRSREAVCRFLHDVPRSAEGLGPGRHRTDSSLSEMQQHGADRAAAGLDAGRRASRGGSGRGSSAGRPKIGTSGRDCDGRRRRYSGHFPVAASH